jgi:hypothetical protein
MPRSRFTLLALPAVMLAAGCGPQVMQPPLAQAPPMAKAGPSGYNAPPNQGGAGVYQWQDVPMNQRVPITRAVFDQGGYQIFAESGETIVVPFVNQNLYAMKFGQTNGAPYFVNEGSAPVLYLSPGGYLENAAAHGARWYPFSQNYAYTQPVYVGIAPSWNDYVGMGWYPGMSYYGGMWGMSPYHTAWMPGFAIMIGGNHYYNYGAYHTYYTTHTNYVPLRSVYNNYSTRSTGSFSNGRSSAGFGRAAGSTGSFRTGGSSTGFGRTSGSTGSFSGGRSGGFAPGSASSGSFSGGRTRSSFDGGATPRGSFSGGSPGFSNTPRTSGGSFSGGRSSGGSFSGGRSGGSSFSSGRSSGGSFGGGRRR